MGFTGFVVYFTQIKKVEFFGGSLLVTGDFARRLPCSRYLRYYPPTHADSWLGEAGYTGVILTCWDILVGFGG